MRTAARVLAAVVLTLILPHARAASTDWRTVDYSALVDRRQLSHSAEPIGALLKRLNGRPLPPPGERRPDLTAHTLLDPLLEPYAFVLADVLDASGPLADPPLVEIGSLWRPGEQQPAWVELMRARSMVLESDGRGKLRALLPADDAVGGPADSESAARAAWDKAWPVLRHALAAERRRLAAAAKDRPEDHPLEVTVHAFRHFPALTRFELGLRPHRATVTDTRPRGDRPPLDLQTWQRFLERGQRLEGARLTRDGAVRLFGSEATLRPAVLGQPLSLADFAVAYRAVFHGGVGEPYMSLDRGLSPQTMIVNYGGRLRDTALGMVSLLCDVRFKTFSQGIDPVTGSDVRDAVRRAVPGFRAHVEHLAADERSAGMPGQQTRLWFYPDAVEIVLSNLGDVMALSRARMTAASERVEAATMEPMKGEDPPWTKNAITAINRDYDALEPFFPELADLDEVVRLLSLFTWLRQARADGLPTPELDALLAVDLPTLTTPRRYPQLLAFDALPAAGSQAPVIVLDRSRLAEALDQLASPGGPPLPAERRLRRALATLDRRSPEQAGLAEELEQAASGGQVDETVLDVQAYRAERLRMHRLVLTSLTAAEKEPLARRNQAGEKLRVFSLGIGGLDLGMGTSLARAGRRTGRIDLGARGPAGFVAGAGAGVAEPPGQGAAAPPGITTPAPREEWRTDSALLPGTLIPALDRPGANAVQVTAGSAGGGRFVRWIYGADGPEARSRRIVLDAAGRAQRFERLENGRLLRFRFVEREEAFAAEITPPPPAEPAVEGAAAPAGLYIVEPLFSDSETPTVRARVRRAGAAPAETEIPRAELQQLVLGRDTGAAAGAADEAIPTLSGVLGAERRVMVLANREAGVPPWDAAPRPIPGEEDAVVLASALRRWWATPEALQPRSVVVGVDPALSPARWERAPAPAPEALVLAPEDAFPANSGALRAGLVQGWTNGGVVSSLPAKVATSVIVLASAEPPALLGARLRSLARNPALKGKLLAVLSLGGPIRRDLPASLLAEGILAGLGAAEAPPAGQPLWIREVLAFGNALGTPGAKDRRVEDLPGPFVWRF